MAGTKHYATIQAYYAYFCLEPTTLMDLASRRPYQSDYLSYNTTSTKCFGDGVYFKPDSSLKIIGQPFSEVKIQYSSHYRNKIENHYAIMCQARQLKLSLVTYSYLVFPTATYSLLFFSRAYLFFLTNFLLNSLWASK